MADEERGGIGKMMKWVGIVGALLSFGGAIYELLHSQADLTERRRVVTEQVGAGREQQAAGYYPAAWDSFEAASTGAKDDGMIAKLLGGLSEQRQQIRTAQEDLAMEWIRTARATEGQSFAELADKLVNTLAAGANVATGARKADLLAHLGWAYFLKSRSGDANVKPDVPYREAIAVDATNPYANVYWGHWILWTHGSLSEANERFAAALATNRARVDVRHFQLAALANVHSPETDAAWLRIVSEMLEQHEAFDPATIRDLYGRYYFALNNSQEFKGMLTAVPADRQLALLQYLLASNDLDPPQKLVLKALLAMTLDAGGHSDDALAKWKELLAETGNDPRSNLATRAQAEIRRLSKPARKTAAGLRAVEQPAA